VIKGLSGASRGLVAAALVAVLVGVSIAPALHAGVGDDPDCDVVVVIHDGTQHRIGALPTSDSDFPHSDHCVLCHLFRISRMAASWRFVPQDLDRSAALRPTESTSIVTRAAIPLPARAPPVPVRT